MLVYVVRRVIGVILTLFGMTVICFFLTHAIPGDPARAAAGPAATAKTVETIRREMGLDKPIMIQYGVYILRMLHGNLGSSIATRRPVLTDIAKVLPASIELALFSALMWLPIGLASGIVCAVRAGGWLDFVSRTSSIVGVSMPVFWLALLIQLLFGHALPIVGRVDVSLSFERITGLYLIDALLRDSPQSFLNVLAHLTLPALTLSIGSIARIGRMTRSCMLEVLGQEYMTTARAKGLSEKLVLYKHGLRNALIPVITVVGLQVGDLISWIFLVETIFAWPGIGQYALRAIVDLDYPSIMGIVLIISCVYTAINFIIDILYTAINPQIKF